MATKVLENISGRMRTYVLTGAHLEAHATHPQRYKPVKAVTVHQSRAGQLVPRTLVRAMPDSIRLAAGDSQEVDEAVLHCPEIRAAIARGELRVSALQPKAPETMPPASAAKSPRTTTTA